MVNNFFEALTVLGSEANVDIDVLVEKVRSAVDKAAKKAYPYSEDRIRVEIDPEKQRFDVLLTQDVVDDEALDINEVNIEDARRRDPNIQVGDTIDLRLDSSQFSRAAALSAKQSIRSDLRDIHRERLLAEFDELENEIIVVTVRQIEQSASGSTVTVEYNGYELYLFPSEQVPGEHLEVGQKLRVYITQISNRQKKPIVKISRASKGLVERLFEKEIPEIYDGVVRIEAISREAGARTKIAVSSNDANVDPVGACIGARQVRINAIVEELGGEKIDLIPYSPVPEEFIARALAPAKVLSVTILDPNARTCAVIVPNNQLSLAIGNRGQNAKLAAKLTNYKIDIKPEFDPYGQKTVIEKPELPPEVHEEIAASEADELLFEDEMQGADDLLSVPEETAALFDEPAEPAEPAEAEPAELPEAAEEADETENGAEAADAEAFFED